MSSSLVAELGLETGSWDPQASFFPFHHPPQLFAGFHIYWLDSVSDGWMQGCEGEHAAKHWSECVSTISRYVS